MTSRRQIFANFTVSATPTAHAGLWLDKFVRYPRMTTEPGKKLGVEALKELIRDLTHLKQPEGYRTSFTRWRNELMDEQMRSGTVRLFELVPLGRAIVGLGEKGVTEIGVSLHHTWGVPYIPGSALKGLMAHTAHRLLDDPKWTLSDETGEKGEMSRELFGSNDEQGLVCVLDARMVPMDGQFLYKDILTSHHQDYYTKAQPAPPSDMDSPNPVSFLSTTCKFVVALECGDSGWTDIAEHLLAKGLETFGVGAKTSAGYGRFELKPMEPTEVDRERLLRTYSLSEKLDFVVKNLEMNVFFGAFRGWLKGADNVDSRFKNRITEVFGEDCLEEVRAFAWGSQILKDELLRRLAGREKQQNQAHEVMTALGLTVDDIQVVEEQIEEDNAVNPVQVNVERSMAAISVVAVTFGNQSIDPVLIERVSKKGKNKDINKLKKILDDDAGGAYTEESVQSALTALGEHLKGKRGSILTKLKQKYGL